MITGSNTNREKEILILLSHGMRSSEIAHELFISRHTVNDHRKNMIKKMAARNSIHMLAIALQKRFIQLDTVQ